MESSLKRVLNGKYVLKKLLGQAGPYDMTYLAEDMSNRNAFVIIREYFPVQLAERSPSSSTLQPFGESQLEQFNFGLNQFEIESRLVNKVTHQTIVNFKETFRENGTAYMVSSYEEGQTLEAFVKRQETTPTFKQAYLFLRDVARGLATAHKTGLIHCRISPKQILRTKQGKTLITRFHMARTVLSNHCGTLELDAEPGFSAPETTFGTSMVGPWTDVYGFAATLLTMVLRESPPSASERSNQDTLLEYLLALNLDDIALRKAIFQALHLDTEARFQSMDAFTSVLDRLLGLIPAPTDRTATSPLSQTRRESALKTVGARIQAAGHRDPKKPAHSKPESNQTKESYGPEVLPKKTEVDSQALHQSTKTLTGVNKSKTEAPKSSKPNPAPQKEIPSLHTLNVPDVATQTAKATVKERPKSTSDPFSTPKSSSRIKPIFKETTTNTVLLAGKEVKSGKADLSSQLKQQALRITNKMPALIWIILIGLISTASIALMTVALLGSDVNTDNSFIRPQPEQARASSEVPYALPIVSGDSLYELAELAIYDGDSLKARQLVQEAWFLYENELSTYAHEVLVQDFANRLQLMRGSVGLIPDETVEVAEEEATRISPFATQLITEGDSLFAIGDLDMARIKYQIAQEYLPEENYLRTMIERIDNELQSDIDQSADNAPQQDQNIPTFASTAGLEEVTIFYDTNDSLQSLPLLNSTSVPALDSVNMLLEQANRDFEVGDWVAARNGYVSILQISPSNDLALSRLNAIDSQQEEIEPSSNIDENGVYIITESPPSLLPESRASMQLTYPQQARLRNIEGRVVLKMIVHEDGTVSDLSIVKGLGYGCDEEAIRVLQDARFEPAEMGGVAVTSWHHYSIRFRISDS